MNIETLLAIWVVLVIFVICFKVLGMNEHENEEPAFEIAVVFPRRIVKEADETCDCVNVLVEEFMKVGLKIERVLGIAEEFIKVGFFCPDNMLFVV